MSQKGVSNSRNAIVSSGGLNNLLKSIFQFFNRLINSLNKGGK